MFRPTHLKPRLRRCLTACAWSAAGIVGFASDALGAITASWANPVDGTWTDPTLWTTNPVFPSNFQPGPVDFYDAVINASSGLGYTVTLNSNITINSLTIASPDVTFQHAGGILQLVDGGVAINLGSPGTELEFAL